MEALAHFGAIIMTLINGVLVPLVFAVAFLTFIWGIFQYFIAGGADEEKRKQGRQLAIWGIIGFVLMIGVWSIVNIFLGTFGFNAGARPGLPTFGGSVDGGDWGGGDPIDITPPGDGALPKDPGCTDPTDGPGC